MPGDDGDAHSAVEAEVHGGLPSGASHARREIAEERADIASRGVRVERDLSAGGPVDDPLQQPRPGCGQSVRPDLAGAERSDDRQLLARGFDRVDEAGQPARRGQGAEGVQHSAVDRLAQADRQNHGIAPQPGRLGEVQDGERLARALAEEGPQLRGVRGQPFDGAADLGGVGRRDAHDGQ